MIASHDEEREILELRMGILKNLSLANRPFIRQDSIVCVEIDAPVSLSCSTSDHFAKLDRALFEGMAQNTVDFALMIGLFRTACVLNAPARVLIEAFGLLKQHCDREGRPRDLMLPGGSALRQGVWDPNLVSSTYSKQTMSI